MSKHPHAENMKLYAKDAAKSDKPWEKWETKFKRDNYWLTLHKNPDWNTEKDYRHIDEYREFKNAQESGKIIQMIDKETGVWNDIPHFTLRFDMTKEYYRIKPNTIKMWQWIYRLNNGEVRISRKFFPDEETMQRHYDKSTTKIIKRADWTEIEVEDEY